MDGQQSSQYVIISNIKSVILRFSVMLNRQICDIAAKFRYEALASELWALLSASG